MFTRFVGLVTIVVFFVMASAAGADSLLDNGGFLSGVTTKGVLTVDILDDIGANSVCFFIRWREVEPEIVNYLTVEEVEGKPGLVDDFIRSGNWDAFDRRIQPFVDAGINVFVVVGGGFSCDIPFFEGRPATPDRLGRENYLGHVFLFASAAARRYKDKVKGFVLEDELNEAALTALFGWRSPSPLTAKSLWSDFDFLTELMESLSRAVRSEAPDALVMVNFHTDIHPNFHAMPSPELSSIVGGKNWIESAVAWQDYMDVVALDAFPNYYTADPVYGSDLGDKVAEIKSSLPGKPVIVLSTGYSVPRDGENPSPANWTEEKQNRYLSEAIESSLRAGARGFFYFDLAGQGCKPPPGGYTEQDLLALGRIGPPFRNGDLTAFMVAVFELGMDYIQGRFVKVIQGAEGFGFMRPDGSRRQAYYTIRRWYKEMIPASQSRAFSNAAKFLNARRSYFQNYPNPFNPETWIPYQLDEDARVVISIYTSTGQLIRTLDLGYKPAGFYTDRRAAAHWDGRNEAGERVSSGVYFYSLSTDDFTAISKMLIFQ